MGDNREMTKETPSGLFDVLKAPVRAETQEMRVLKFRAQPRWVPLSVLIVIGLAALAPYLLSYELTGWSFIAVVAAYVVAVLVFLLIPLLRFLTRTTLITTKRIIVRYGIITRHRHEIALAHISEMHLRRSFSQRIYKSGDIAVHTVTGTTAILRDVPGCVVVADALQELLSWQIASGANVRQNLAQNR